MIKLAFIFMLVVIEGAIAPAALTRDALVGEWRGKMTVEVGKEKRSHKIGAIFRADGTCELTTEGDPKPASSTYVIDQGTIVVRAPVKDQGNHLRLTGVKWTKTTIEADAVPADDSHPPPPQRTRIFLKRK